ncbi:unnamed protein product [Arabidopsis halleri]
MRGFKNESKLLSLNFAVQLQDGSELVQSVLEPRLGTFVIVLLL